jgi:hypothetical protein
MHEVNEALACRPEPTRGTPERSEGGSGGRLVGRLRVPGRNNKIHALTSLFYFILFLYFFCPGRMAATTWENYLRRLQFGSVLLPTSSPRSLGREDSASHQYICHVAYTSDIGDYIGSYQSPLRHKTTF